MSKMKLLVLIVLLHRAARAVESSCLADSCYAIGDIRRCSVASSNVQPLYRMEVLPGGGFDNLRNLDMGQVHAHTYKDCQTTRDGKYLLPDNVFLTPRQESNVNIYSEFFDHWDNHTSTTSSAINADVSFFSAINGKYSEEYSNTKTRQVNDNAKTTRTQLRYDLYTLAIQPGAELHPKLRQALMDIGANIQNNNTEYASYLAELLVRDYGTHYVTSIDAGAVISKIDQINSTLFGEGFQSSSKIVAAAGASFYQYVSVNIESEDSTSTEEMNLYRNHITHSKVTSYGGPSFQPKNFSLNDWVRGIPDTLATTGRSGKPLHFVINTNTLPNLPEITVFEVSKVVEDAIRCYYQGNGRLGCTDRNSINFDFQANVDDNSCDLPTNNFTFGGVYQTCVATAVHTNNLCSYSNDPKYQRNPLTGEYSCPPLYTPIKLHQGTISKPTTVRSCYQDCGWFSCDTECRTQYRLDQAEYDTYWCAALEESALPENSGYLFGGFYTPTTNNPLTGTKACPRYFEPLSIMRDVKVCVSSDYELGTENSAMFGGFFTCRVGNPLASTNVTDKASWRHGCPQGSTQHLVTIDQNCEISFCVQAGSFKSRSLTPIKLPPFTPRPDFKANVTDTLVVAGLYGTVWLKNSTTGEWYQRDNTNNNAEALLLEQTGGQQSQGTGRASSQQPAVIALSVVSSIVIAMLVVIIASIIIYKVRKPRLPSKNQANCQLQKNYNVDS